MNWRDLSRQLNNVLERQPDLSNKPALVRHGDVLYELDLYRSLSTGVLHISAEYPGASQRDNPSIVPESEVSMEDAVTLHATSFTRK